MTVAKYQEISRLVMELSFREQFRLMADIIRFWALNRFRPAARHKPRLSALALLYEGTPRSQRSVDEINQQIRELRDEWDD